MFQPGQVIQPQADDQDKNDDATQNDASVMPDPTPTVGPQPMDDVTVPSDDGPAPVPVTPAEPTAPSSAPTDTPAPLDEPESLGDVDTSGPSTTPSAVPSESPVSDAPAPVADNPAPAPAPAPELTMPSDNNAQSGGDEPHDPDPGGTASPPPTDSEPTDTSDSPSPADNGAQITWEAPEYLDHQHSFGWYALVIIIAAALAVGSVLVLKEWLSAVVIALMAVALMIYARRKPRTLDYAVGETGVKIARKFYAYNIFRSFSVVSLNSVLTVELEPLKRFMPRLSLLVEKMNVESIAAVLGRYLPQEERRADLIDRLSHALHF